MTETVSKVTIPVQHEIVVTIPEGSEILHAGSQDGMITVWFRCDPERPKRERRIRLCGTGNEAPDSVFWRHFATVLTHGSGRRLAWHLFEMREEI